MPNILFAATTDRWADYEAPLTAALDATGLDYRLATEMPPEEVDYIVYAPNSAVQDFTPYNRLKAVLNLWAGVENVTGNETLRAPLARMVDDEGLGQGMVEWVTGHVLRHHLGMDTHIVNPDRTWDDTAPPLSRDRPVTILGLGTLGQACAKALRGLGFPVTGWSRSAKQLSGVRCLNGAEGLGVALDGARIVVLLLPDTAATENTLDAGALARLAPGAVVLNPGRGPLIDDEALLAALDSGQVGHATLDVFRVEPLPVDHPYWAHPKVTVTPHIASATRPESAARVIAENIRRGEAGEPLLHLVDRAAGY
ncbi:2-hydroxyacid dehydrogenase [Ponticoccus alexandrii]|uniref:Glyoxylate/hydroxypyruvate reductase A n=1 Tax=Ponticoccus alexandrii TaxID=1943633 RepID=A0ABX7FAG4_9RHOB|nr:glyoxylate/hydroxypyruvate reductase A [Ponticoccus alexandrii]ETA50831.1 hydroxyacid dehydrogenase [Rhodobacteraceae bacterium PD-2]QRF67378.1 glyoxylate/hydroxypyruvate reductase A [Ponticoccus alexandrii]